MATTRLPVPSLTRSVGLTNPPDTHTHTHTHTHTRVRRDPDEVAPVLVKRTIVKESEVSTAFKHNPTARLADVKVPGTELAFKMYVHDPKLCKYMSRSILEQHSWEGHHASRLIKAVKAVPGRNFFLDIGANVGYFAMSVASSGVDVVAIEPALFNTELIAASAGMRGLANLRLYKSAVSDKVEKPLCAMPNEAVGGDPSHNQGNFQLRPLADCKKHGGQYKASEVVPVSTVDEILKTEFGPTGGVKCFAALKIDVEGFETKALRGAGSVLRGDCPPCVIMVEYIKQPELFDLLVDDFGYKCRGLGHKRANGQWKIKPVDADKPYLRLSDQDYQCLLVKDKRCAGAVEQLQADS